MDMFIRKIKTLVLRAWRFIRGIFVKEDAVPAYNEEAEREEVESWTESLGNGLNDFKERIQEAIQIAKLEAIINGEDVEDLDFEVELVPA